nr:MAG TPA: hypothetical protein [Bacteriophage sp.]
MALASSVAVILPVVLLRAGQFLSLWYRLEPGLSDTYTLPPAVSAVWKASASALLEEEDNLPIAKPIIKKPMQKVTRPKQKNFFESLSFLSISYLQSSMFVIITITPLINYHILILIKKDQILSLEDKIC